MKRAVRNPLLLGTLSAGVALATLLGGSVWAQPKSAKADAEKTAAKTESKTAAKTAAKTAKGRLPNFYAEIVDDSQKEKIYAIQAKYAANIDALEAQVKALKAARDKDIESVLTADQLKKIEALEAEAKAKKTLPAKTPAKTPAKP